MRKKALAVELRSIIDTVKQLDFAHKEVCNGLTRAENAYSDKMTDLTGGGHLRRLKHSLFRLQKQCAEMGVTAGVMHQTLFTAGGMRHGAHHLYDHILDEAAAQHTGPLPNERQADIRDEDFD